MQQPDSASTTAFALGERPTRRLKLFYLLAMTSLGGTAHIALRMAQGLAARGHDLTLFLPDGGGDLYARARAYGLTVDTHMAMTPKLRQPVRWVSDAVYLKRRIEESQPDILQSFRPPDLYMALGARAMLAQSPALVSVRAIVNPVVPHPFNTAVQRALIDQVICSAEVIYRRFADPATDPCPDEAGVYIRKKARRLMSWWNQRSYDLGKIGWLRDGVDPQRTQPAWEAPAALVTRLNARRELGFDEDTVVVGMLGRMAAVKGHKTLAQALQALQERNPDRPDRPARKVGVLLVGPTNTNIQHMIEGMLKDYQRAGRLKITGYRTDPVSCLHAMDIFVHPSLGSEGNARALLEALSCGLCPVVSTAGILPEYVRHEDNGLVFEVGDWRMLADHLERLIQSPAMRRQFARRSRELAATEYSHEHFIDRLEWLYGRLVERHSVAGAI
ncbi:MAG: glycosyltransferase family 4 protein [Planctomycetota bacterium]